MFKEVSRVLVIALMLVAFVGQALAYNTSLPCEASVDSFSSNFSELIKHNDSKPIDTDSLEDCCGIECCSFDCICIANACSSFVYFKTKIDSTKTSTLSESVYIQEFEQPKSIATLLYRPPILSS